MYFTVFASNRLPLHPTSTDRADLIYQKHLGTMLVPPIDFEKKEALEALQKEREELQKKLHKDHKTRHGKPIQKQNEEEDDDDDEAERSMFEEDSLSVTGADTNLGKASAGDRTEEDEEEDLKKDDKKKNHLPEGQLPLMGIRMRKQGKFPPLVSKEWEFEGGKDWDRAFVGIFV
jgi:hypothetical protein